jgi:K+-sensing histidine kinase KdpD
MYIDADNKSNDNSKQVINMSSVNGNIINSYALLTGMSHEMRTHMNAIISFSFLMKENDYNDEECGEFNSYILNSCEQLIGLFEGFLDAAIIDTGKLKSEYRICQLDTILDELFSEFRKVLIKADIKDLVLATEKKCPDLAEVFIDSNKVLRVISCLFQNALKNTKSGYIKIGYDFSDEKVTFYVLDSGQNYSKCKEFLYSDDLNESLTKFYDTGLAVNITLAKKIVQSLGGSIWIECIGITGSGIYFSIPVKVIESLDTSKKKYAKTLISIV